MREREDQIFEISGSTKLICLLGSPVSHSLSPRIHNSAFRELGLDYVYLAFDVKTEDLTFVLDALRRMGTRGLNLTMPLKRSVLPLCDTLSEAAEISESVNTVVFSEDGRIEGHSTDGSGFFRGLESEGISYRGKKLVLLGAGGAGTAILVQAALSGVRELSLFVRRGSRDLPRIRRILASLRKRSSCIFSLLEYGEALYRELSDCDILVNASSVGMAPDKERSLIEDSSFFPEGLTVADVIYSPRKTKLLRLAEERGLRTVNGLPMLLFQGAEAFRLWCGREMPMENIRRNILNYL